MPKHQEDGRVGRIVRAGVRAKDEQLREQSKGGPDASRAVNKLIRTFRWRVESAGIHAALARSIAYVKPSERRRAARRKAGRGGC